MKIFKKKCKKKKKKEKKKKKKTQQSKTAKPNEISEKVKNEGKKEEEIGETESERLNLERFTTPLTPPPRERETHLATHLTELQRADSSLSTVGVTYPNGKWPHQRCHGPRETHRAADCLICLI